MENPEKLYNQELPEKNVESYAQENLGLYIALDHRENGIRDPEIEGYLQEINHNREVFYNETLPNISDEEFDMVVDFVVEQKSNEEIEKRLNDVCFDYERLIKEEGENKDKIKVILDLFLKAESYQELAENSKEIAFSGFEEDSDFKNIESFIKENFSEDLLKK